MAISINSKVKEVIDNERAAPILEKYIAGSTTSPQMVMAYGLTVKTVCGFPQSKMNKEQTAALAAELEALGE